MSSSTELKYTALDEIEPIRDSLKSSFRAGKIRSIEYRKEQLLQLAYMMKENIPAFEAALAKDLGRPQLEAHLFEISLCVNEAVSAYHSVEKWAKTDSAWSLKYFAAKPAIIKEPKGVVLIISPFNYPVWLCMGPLCGAIAAGNTAVIKPSELTPACSALLAELFPKYMDPDLYRIVNGGVEETTKLLSLQWDHILYVGNGRVGRIVAAAAAKHLTPVTLELGGKSPVIIDPNYDMEVAARRISWGKFSNAGQTCTAPDFVLIPESGQDKFVEAMKKTHQSFYPEGPANSKDFGRVVSDIHFKRLAGLLSETKGQVVFGGETDASQKYIAPTVVRDVKLDDSLMTQEIFGPILPVVPIKTIDDAIEHIQSKDHPLAIYVFSDDAEFKKKIYENTQSGGILSNEVVIQPAVDYLPFGGVGESGYGFTNGKYTFDSFTHMRCSLDIPKWFDKLIGGRYPPYKPQNLSRLKPLIYPSLPAKKAGSSKPSQLWLISVVGILIATTFASRNVNALRSVLQNVKKLVGA